MWHRIESLLQLARIGHARSSVVNPLQWVLVILLFGFLAAVLERAPEWILIFLACLLGALFILLFGSFVYFMFKDPDALRSENYSLVKRAIDRRVFGDSLAGTKDAIVAFGESESQDANAQLPTDIGRKHE